MITVSIDVTRIDKSKMVTKNGKTYLNLVLWETENDKYGNDYKVVQGVSKEDRDAGVKGAILGNGKKWGKPGPAMRKAVDGMAGKANVKPAIDDGESDVPF